MRKGWKHNIIYYKFHITPNVFIVSLLVFTLPEVIQNKLLVVDTGHEHWGNRNVGIPIRQFSNRWFWYQEISVKTNKLS